MPLKKEIFDRITEERKRFMNTSDAREQRANEEIDLELEYERVKEQRYKAFQEWLNDWPLVVTDYQDFTTEFQIDYYFLSTIQIHYPR